MKPTPFSPSGTDELQRIVETHLHEKGWDVIYKLELEISPTPHLLEAGINRESWQITYHIDPALQSRLEQLLAREKIAVENSVQKLLCAAADHEEGHWSICPFDIEYLEDIFHGIGTGLQKAGWKEEDIVLRTPDIANQFMDVVENMVQGLDEKTGEAFGEGLGIFYLNQLRQPGCSPPYALFVDTQMKGYGKRWNGDSKRTGLFRRIGEKKLQPNFRAMAEEYPQYSKIKKDVPKLLACLLPAPLAEKAYHQGLDAYDAQLVTEELLKKELWAGKAEAFAQIIAPYAAQEMKQEASDGTCGDEGSGGDSSEDTPSPHPSQGGSQNKKRQRRTEKESNSAGKSQQGNKVGGKRKQKQQKHHGRCSFARELWEDPETRKKILRRALAKGRQPGPAGMPYAASFESFEAAYDLAAEEIVVQYFQEDGDSELPVFDLFWMQNRKLEDGDSLSRKINWSKTLFSPKPGSAEPWLYAHEVPYQIDEELLPGKRSLEDMLFVVDVSGSMGWTGQPLDGSKYDLSLRSIFGCIKSLERLGRAAHAQYGLILFSSSTAFSGWEGYYCLDKFKKLVFTGYQGQGTELDAAAVQRALQSNQNPFLTLLITDGEIYNHDAAAAAIQKLLGTGHDVVQFSIQGDTQFSRTIRGYGAQIVPVTTPEDLAGLIIEKIKRRYP